MRRKKNSCGKSNLWQRLKSDATMEPYLRLATSSTSASPHRDDQPARREPFAVTGWPLKPLTRLDQNGARGCSADLATAGLLSRQAAFVTFACVDLDSPEPFLARLGITTQGAAGIGEALRTRSARNLIAAAFGLSSNAVPAGYLRALVRVRENRDSAEGTDPFAEPSSYRRLWEIFTGEPDRPKAMALRFCGPLSSVSLKAADDLDPVLLHGEVLRHLTSPERIAKANALLDLLRGALSTATDESLFTALQASLRSGSPLENFARKAIEQADRFPVPPLRYAEDVQPLTSAQALIAFGSEMKNCARTKISETLLGIAYVYKLEHRDAHGALTVLAAELTPLSDGRWMVRELKGTKNKHPKAAVMRWALRRLHSLGAVSPWLQTNQRSSALRSLLGVYRWDMMEIDSLEDEASEEAA